MQQGFLRATISTTRSLLLLLSLLPLSAMLQAQTEPRSTLLYRCGPDGRDLRDSPCPESAARPAQSVQHDQPSAAQAREARERAEQQQRQADALERERLAREAKSRPAPPSGIHHRSEPAVGAASAPAAKGTPNGGKHKKSSRQGGKKPPHAATSASAARP